MKKLWNTYTDKLGKTLFHPQFIMNRSNAHAIEQAQKKIRRNKIKKIVDIGSGRSTYKSSFIHLVDTYHTLDHPETSELYSPEDQVDFKYDITKKTGFKKGTYDSALLFQVIEYLEDAGDAFEEINRITNNSAIIFATSPFLYPIHDPPFDMQRYTNSKLKKLLESKGFKKVQVHPYGNIIDTVVLFILVSLFYKVNEKLSKDGFLNKMFGALILFCGLIITMPLNFTALLFGNETQKSNSRFVFNYYIVARK